MVACLSAEVVILIEVAQRSEVFRLKGPFSLPTLQKSVLNALHSPVVHHAASQGRLLPISVQQ